MKTGHAVKVSRRDTLQVLRIPPRQGKRLLPWSAEIARDDIPSNILEDTDIINVPEMHENEVDYWECLEGSVTFTCGGNLVNSRQVRPGEWIGDAIDGGDEYVLRQGDRLWIPPWVPHMHSAKGTARLMITKIR